MTEELEIVIPEYVAIALSDVALKTGRAFDDVVLFFLLKEVVHTQRERVGA
ncbi:MAG: hypothetical protein LBW77_04565 [Verrucomicrobiota bacterium]|jgi:hypothetical protein|nr:hypothetical protein [Verrucomicrobiota bacterium]